MVVQGNLPSMAAADFGALPRCEVHGHAIHAVTQAGGLGAVFKHMPEVAATAAAQYLGAFHEQGGVRVFDDGI